MLVKRAMDEFQRTKEDGAFLSSKLTVTPTGSKGQGKVFPLFNANEAAKQIKGPADVGDDTEKETEVEDFLDYDSGLSFTFNVEGEKGKATLSPKSFFPGSIPPTPKSSRDRICRWRVEGGLWIVNEDGTAEVVKGGNVNDNDSNSNSSVAKLISSAWTKLETALLHFNVAQVLSAMTDNSELHQIQVMGCYSLMKLASSQRAQILDLGGIEVALCAMDRHFRKATVQFGGCALFRAMAEGSDASKMRIAELGGIKAVLRAMLEHKEDRDVQEEGLRLLRRLALAESEALACMIADLDGIKAIASSMAAHRNDAKIQELGCGVLVALACSGNRCCDKIGEEGGVDAVIAAMSAKQHERNQRVQGTACRALRNFAMDVNVNCGMIERGGGIELIARALRSHRGQHEVQEEGTAALLNLSFHFVSRIKMEKLEIGDLAWAAYQDHNIREAKQLSQRLT